MRYSSILFLSCLIFVSSCGSGDSDTTSTISITSPPHTNQIETSIQESFNSDISTEEKLNNIFYVIQYIDWTKYFSINQEKTLDLIHFISEYSSQLTDEQIIKLFLATTGLDGVSAESYAGLVGKLFINDMDKVIKDLSQIDDFNQIKKVSKYVVYYCSYHDTQNIVLQLKLLKQKQTTLTKEKEVISTLLDEFENVEK
jgi:hypothetical protein